jgi:phospholipase A1
LPANRSSACARSSASLDDFEIRLQHCRVPHYLRIGLWSALLACALAWPADAQRERTFVLENTSNARYELSAPAYIITGFDHNDPDGAQSNNNQLRFRIPARYLIARYSPGTSKLHWYFDFIQDAFWNIRDESAPFFDNNFAPGTYLYVLPWNWMVAGAIGVRHLSNGRDGELSRSWNKLYGSLAFGDPLINAFFGSVSSALAFDVSEENSDIQDFVGHADTELYFVPGAIMTPTPKYLGGDRLSLSLRAGLLGSKVIAYVETSIWFRIPKEVDAFSFSLFVQHFTGTGENLREYSTQNSSFRIGFGTTTFAGEHMR